MNEIKFKLVDGEPICQDDCPGVDSDICCVENHGFPCIPGLRQQRDALESQIITVHEDFAELREERERKIERLRAQVERLESRVDEPCGDCATARADDLEKKLEAVNNERDAARNYLMEADLSYDKGACVGIVDKVLHLLGFDELGYDRPNHTILTKKASECDDPKYKYLDPKTRLYYCPECGIGFGMGAEFDHVEAIQKYGKCLTCCDKKASE